MSQYCLTASTHLGHLLKQCISSNNGPNPMQVILSLCSALVRPHLSSLFSFGLPSMKETGALCERVQ